MKLRKIGLVLALMTAVLVTATGCKKSSGGDEEGTTTKEQTKGHYAELNKEVTGLKVHYDMTLSDDGKLLVDKSGNGNDGTLGKAAKISVDDGVLFMEDGGYVQFPEGLFQGEDTLTISVWLKNYSGATNTSALFVGTKETSPKSYWLLNPCNPSGLLKSVFTNTVNGFDPYRTEVGISPSVSGNGKNGPATDMDWSHYVTVITPTSITAYYNGEKVGSEALKRTISDFGENIVGYIGKSSYSADPTFTGFFKDVKVYDEVLSDADVKKLYEEHKEIKIVEKGTETEIFIEDRADPYITLGNDGYYYFTASYPMYGGGDANGYDRIILRRAKTIEELKDAEEKVIWDESESIISYRFIWAPEIHYIDGKWYMYYAASTSSNNVWDIRCHVLMCTGDDPYNDEWVEKGKFQAAEGDSVSFTGFSLDMTYFECNGRHYVIWAQSVGNSNLYMAEINPAEPWKTITKAMLLTKPEYYWEKINIPVNEGASVVIHDGKVIVAYSASATGPEYCIGIMYADVNADLLDINSWTKQKTPALTSDDLIGEYGPGHNSFTVDENGDVIFVYHSRSQECYEGKCGYGNQDPLYDPCRSARIRKVVWDEDGLPILNQ